MKRVRYPAEFKAEAVKQVTERGHGVVDVAKRLGMSDKSLYLWVRLAKEQSSAGGVETSQLKAEVSRLLIRPCEVLSRVANVTILEVANNALRVLLQHRHVIIGSLA